MPAWLPGHPKQDDVADVDAVLVSVRQELHPVEVLERLEDPVELGIGLEDPDPWFLHVGHGNDLGRGDLSDGAVDELEHPLVTSKETGVLRHVSVQREPRRLAVVAHGELVRMELRQRRPHLVPVVEGPPRLAAHPVECQVDLARPHAAPPSDARSASSSTMRFCSSLPGRNTVRRRAAISDDW